MFTVFQKGKLFKILQREQGSALVLVMFVVLLLTILGLGVLSATVGGSQRTETRESDVQTLHLTEKSLEEAAAYITSGLNGKKLSPDALQDTITNNINELLTTKSSVQTDLSNAEGTIKNITFDNPEEASKTLIYKLTVTAEAKVNGVTRQLQQQLIIDANPDFLKYALGSEGDVIINGAPLIQGNLYAGGELKIRDLAYYKYMGSPTREASTIYPVVSPIVKGDDYGQVYVQSLNSIQYASGSSGNYNNIATGTSSGTVVTQDDIINSNLKDVLGLELNSNSTDPVYPLDKINIKKHQKFVQIDVEESFIDKLVEATSSNNRDLLKEYFIDNDPNISLTYPSTFNILHNEPRPIPPTDTEAPDYEDKFDEYESSLQDYLDNLAKLYTLNTHAVLEDNLVVNGIDYEDVLFTEQAKEDSKWLIVKGNLFINNESVADTINVRGNILVTGDVIIKGKVNFDSTMFVLGKATIDDAIIHGLSNKQLVLISQKDMLVNRVDKFSSQVPDRMDAFLYTEGQATLYGVGTTLSINGGVFSKGTLTINAVVGEVLEPTSASSATPLLFNGGDYRRLQIKYDKSIYEAQKGGLPRVNQVNVTKGPLKLIPISAQP
ncbi:hypothetical protein R70723_30200 [Paenibacillus sp. FSL R7-0273]|uniref:hypothetical protein n=1 Tax=Paenibacillus sp. FSL R7-0273 TaxID=1536772 RepID=UPI0004F85F7E|nr:hypothetical protein [Paenibacillus sp. FSL R7-0273]AIQ49676.1 hypothetical protein R70723_30200 [Paenibacillus sp. FSL R7-0273]OMF90263.1 hypothetical protein BK144_17860 [Paenibacillus sp. FSL R7-0273]